MINIVLFVCIAEHWSSWIFWLFLIITSIHFVGIYNYESIWMLEILNNLQDMKSKNMTGMTKYNLIKYKYLWGWKCINLNMLKQLKIYQGIYDAIKMKFWVELKMKVI